MADGDENGSNKKKSFGRGGSRGGRGGFFNRQGGSGGGQNFGAMIPKGDAISVGNSKEMEWRHFLSIPDMKDTSVQLKLKMAEKYLETKIPKAITESEKFKSFPLSYKDIINDKELQLRWPTLKHDLSHNSQKVLGIFGQAASAGRKKLLYPRLRKFTELPTPMENLKSSMVNRLLSVKGTVIRVANVMQMHTWVTFQCLKCDSYSSVEQKPKGKFTKPKSCPQDGCKSQTFTEMRTNPSTITVNSQMIRLQESSSSSGGRIPRSINCHLTRDLCDSVGVGDVVTVIAVAKVTTEADQSYNLYLDAVSILNASQVSFVLMCVNFFL